MPAHSHAQDYHPFPRLGGSRPPLLHRRCPQPRLLPPGCDEPAHLDEEIQTFSVCVAVADELRGTSERERCRKV